MCCLRFSLCDPCALCHRTQQAQLPYLTEAMSVVKLPSTQSLGIMCCCAVLGNMTADAMHDDEIGGTLSTATTALLGDSNAGAQRAVGACSVCTAVVCCKAARSEVSML
jgi:hypothetical protein